MSSRLDQGRRSFGAHAWRDAYAQLSAADQETPLEPEDLERLAMTSFLTGNDDAGDEFWTRAHHGYLERGDVAGAVRCAIEAGFGLINRAQFAPAMGWFARGQRLLDENDVDCVERGHLLMPVGISKVDEDPAAALAIFETALQIGVRFGNADLVAIARTGCGRALLRMGEMDRGLALLDEVMVAATAGELSPNMTGNVYCTVIEGLFEVLDMRRAGEWTSALHRWNESQPGLVRYRGQCLVHRAEIMQMHGEWADAITETRQACERLERHPMLGAALYQLGDLLRLRGEFGEAEDTFRRAGERGREPQAGLALMRRTQGQVDAADASVRRVLEGTENRLERARLLGPYVEIAIEAKNIEAAKMAADELAAIATELGAPYLEAVSLRCAGLVALADGNPESALVSLHRARKVWHELDAPYEVALVRVAIGLACRALGDDDSAEMELAAARAAFDQLGAGPDVARVDRLSAPAEAAATGGLSAREVEVLQLVATGKTNRAIAKELVLSEKTVARHVSNIFTKLGVASRSAATAYAYENDLV